MPGPLRELCRVCQANYAVRPPRTRRTCRTSPLRGLVSGQTWRDAAPPGLTPDKDGCIIALPIHPRPEAAMAPHDEKLAVLRAAHAVLGRLA